MARKPNYKFERFQREKSKAEKKAARVQAHADKAAAKIEAAPEAETPRAWGICSGHRRVRTRESVRRVPSHQPDLKGRAKPAVAPQD